MNAIIAYFANADATLIKFIKNRTFKTTLLASKLINSCIKITSSIWRHIVDEILASILRKEYGYIVEEAYLLRQSELISNKQKMNNCLIIMQKIGNCFYSHQYLLNMQLVWNSADTYLCLVIFGNDIGWFYHYSITFKYKIAKWKISFKIIYYRQRITN